MVATSVQLTWWSLDDPQSSPGTLLVSSVGRAQTAAAVRRAAKIVDVSLLPQFNLYVKWVCSVVSANKKYIYS